MKTKFKCITGKISTSFKFPGNIALYNKPEYLNTWPGIQHISCYIIKETRNEIDGCIHFQVIGDIGHSHFTAPFGSFSITEKVDFETLRNFIEFIETHLRNTGIKELRIKHYPGFYRPDTGGLVIAALALNGYSISNIDINHYIEVSGNAFSDIIHAMESRNLKKCIEACLIFREHQNIDAELVFKNIESFRKRKNIPVNIELGTLMKLSGTFPGKYRYFSVSNDKGIIAATICVQVNDQVLYNFLPAYDERYKSLSPIVFLTQGIYNYALSENFKLIDLGISSLQGTPQPGLIKFKERLGGKPESKLSFHKVIQ